MLETESDEFVILKRTPSKAIEDIRPDVSSEEVREKPAESKEARLKLEGEDVRRTNKAFRRVKVAEMSCALLALFGFGCFGVSTDLQYTSSLYHSHQFPCAVSLLLGTFSTLILAATIIWRCMLEFHWEQARCLYSVHDNFLNTGKWTQICLELAIILPHPMLWLEGLTANHEVTVSTSGITLPSHSISYTINALLTVWSQLRLYYVLRLLFVETIYSSARAQRICRMNGGSAGQSFALRCLMKDSPYALVLSFLGAGVFCGAYAIRIFERPMSPSTGMDFSSYANCIWYCLITILTVGYGDYYAVTLPGRIIAFLVCLWGIVLVSVMICFVAGMLSFDSGERNALDILHRLEFRKKFQQSAALVLTAGLKYCLIARKHPASLQKYAYLLGHFRRYVNDFESMRVLQRKLYKVDTWEDNVQRRVRILTEENDRLKGELEAVRGVVVRLRDRLRTKAREQGKGLE